MTILLAMLVAPTNRRFPPYWVALATQHVVRLNEAYVLALKSMGDLRGTYFSLCDFTGDPLGLGEGVVTAGLGDTAGAAGVAAGAVADAAGLV